VEGHSAPAGGVRKAVCKDQPLGVLKVLWTSEKRGGGSGRPDQKHRKEMETWQETLQRAVRAEAPLRCGGGPNQDAGRVAQGGKLNRNLIFFESIMTESAFSGSHHPHAAWRRIGSGDVTTDSIVGPGEGNRIVWHGCNWSLPDSMSSRKSSTPFREVRIESDYQDGQMSRCRKHLRVRPVSILLKESDGPEFSSAHVRHCHQHLDVCGEVQAWKARVVDTRKNAPGCGCWINMPSGGGRVQPQAGL